MLLLILLPARMRSDPMSVLESNIPVNGWFSVGGRHVNF